MVSPAARRGPRSDRGGRGPGRGGNRSGDGSGSSGGGERRGGRGGRGRDRERPPREDDSGGFSERVVHTRRIAKVVKGGRRLRFNALVVVGDGQGRVGAGMGKALAIPDAVRKGTAVARRGAITIPIKGSTIPHEISVRKGASIVIIKPAPLGTGIIAAGAMRAMLELGGVQDVVGKSLGSRNPINIVQATLAALEQLRDPETERAQRLATVRPATNGAGAAAVSEYGNPGGNDDSDCDAGVSGGSNTAGGSSGGNDAGARRGAGTDAGGQRGNRTRPRQCRCQYRCQRQH